jgi:hypothetical protein
MGARAAAGNGEGESGPKETPQSFAQTPAKKGEGKAAAEEVKVRRQEKKRP